MSKFFTEKEEEELKLEFMELVKKKLDAKGIKLSDLDEDTIQAKCITCQTVCIAKIK